MCVCSLLKGHRSGKSLRVRKRREESSEASKSFAPKSERSCISASPICWRVILSNIHSKPKRKARPIYFTKEESLLLPGGLPCVQGLWIIIEFSRDTAPFVLYWRQRNNSRFGPMFFAFSVLSIEMPDF